MNFVIGETYVLTFLAKIAGGADQRVISRLDSLAPSAVYEFLTKHDLLATLEAIENHLPIKRLVFRRWSGQLCVVPVKAPDSAYRDKFIHGDGLPKVSKFWLTVKEGGTVPPGSPFFYREGEGPAGYSDGWRVDPEPRVQIVLFEPQLYCLLANLYGANCVEPIFYRGSALEDLHERLPNLAPETQEWWDHEL